LRGAAAAAAAAVHLWRAVRAGPGNEANSGGRCRLINPLYANSQISV